MSKRFIVVLLVCILAIGGVFFLTHKKAAAPMTTQLTNHTIGAGKKGVTLTEYGDFACPACYQYYPLVEQVRAKYGDDITFQFRNFPLLEIHQNALAGARAAEAASLQGKFWDMYNTLYQNQPTWGANTVNNPVPFLDSYAKQLGLNVVKFDTDMNSDAVNQIVQADRAEALHLGFTGTPTFLLDGKQITSPSSVADFEKVIDAEIAKKNPTPKT